MVGLSLCVDKWDVQICEKVSTETAGSSWPRNASEARLLTRQEFRWLMEGLSIDQPKAIKGTGRKKDF